MNVIYTAISGAYDTLATDFEPEPGWKYIAFIDDATNVAPGPWEIRPLPKLVEYGDHPRLRTRRAKILAHQYLPAETRLSVWCDGSFSDLNGIGAKAQHLLFKGTKHIAAYVHPEERPNIAEEASVVVAGGFDSHADVEKSIAAMRADGVDPTTLPVYAAGFLVRRHCPVVTTFNLLWWYMLCAGSSRDQITLPWAILRSGVSMQPIREYMRGGDHFVIRPHAHQEPGRSTSY